MSNVKGLVPLVGLLVACTAAPAPQVNVICAPGGAGGTPNGGGGTPGDGGNANPGGGTPPVGGAPPAGQWVNSTSNLAGLASECGNLSGLFVKPDEDAIIAGVATQGLWTSRDGGQTWEALGTGPGSALITNRPVSVAFDPDHPEIFYESGLYNGGGVYKTTDSGATFVQLGDVTHSDLVAVDFTDPDRKTLLAGGHEQGQMLHRSSDAGATWTNVGVSFPAKTTCSYPFIVDSQTYLVGCDGIDDGLNGILRTTDGGTTWDEIAKTGGGREPLRASDGSIYWTSPDKGGMARSTDDGATWEEVTSGGILRTTHPVELPDGRIASLGNDNVLVTADQGKTWSLASAKLPFEDAVGVVYSAPQKAFFIWRFSCDNVPIPVPDDAVMRFDYDWEKQ